MPHEPKLLHNDLNTGPEVTYQNLMLLLKLLMKLLHNLTILFASKEHNRHYQMITWVRSLCDVSKVTLSAHNRTRSNTQNK